MMQMPNDRKVYSHDFPDGSAVYFTLHDWGVEIEPLGHTHLKTYRLASGQVYVETFREVQLPLPLELT